MTQPRYHAINADARRLPLADKSVDLVFGSPPYEAARTYGIGLNLRGQYWVDWMVDVYLESLRVCSGLVAFVIEGQTRNYRYSVVPALLMADLHRRGIHLRKPPIYHRIGIPGSGGPDWLRNDWEFVVCATSGGKLPWSDNTACGHPPKWAPGGAMSHRLSDGTRKNQWGGGEKSTERQVDGEIKTAVRPSHVITTIRNAHGVTSSSNRRRSGDGKREKMGRRVTSGHADGDTPNDDTYLPPVLANPGNLIKCKVGGNLMGSPLSHENEAPFPETLSDFFVRSFCPTGGVVLDPFSGSGTTGASSVRAGRRYIGVDIRESQCNLTRRRMNGLQVELEY